MKLHEDKDAFGLLLENIHEKTGYRTDVLEKDYYVVITTRRPTTSCRRPCSARRRNACREGKRCLW